MDDYPMESHSNEIDYYNVLKPVLLVIGNRRTLLKNIVGNSYEMFIEKSEIDTKTSVENLQIVSTTQFLHSLSKIGIILNQQQKSIVTQAILQLPESSIDFAKFYVALLKESRYRLRAVSKKDRKRSQEQIDIATENASHSTDLDTISSNDTISMNSAELYRKVLQEILTAMERQHPQSRRQLYNSIIECSYSIFMGYDSNEDSKLSPAEFHTTLSRLGLSLNPTQMRAINSMIDTDGDFPEFYKALSAEATKRLRDFDMGIGMSAASRNSDSSEQESSLLISNLMEQDQSLQKQLNEMRDKESTFRNKTKQLIETVSQMEQTLVDSNDAKNNAQKKWTECQQECLAEKQNARAELGLLDSKVQAEIDSEKVLRGKEESYQSYSKFWSLESLNDVWVKYDMHQEGSISIASFCSCIQDNFPELFSFPALNQLYKKTGLIRTAKSGEPRVRRDEFPDMLRELYMLHIIQNALDEGNLSALSSMDTSKLSITYPQFKRHMKSSGINLDELSFEAEFNSIEPEVIESDIPPLANRSAPFESYCKYRAVLMGHTLLASLMGYNIDVLFTGTPIQTPIPSRAPSRRSTSHTIEENETNIDNISNVGRKRPGSRARPALRPPSSRARPGSQRLQVLQTTIAGQGGRPLTKRSLKRVQASRTRRNQFREEIKSCLERIKHATKEEENMAAYLRQCQAEHHLIREQYDICQSNLADAEAKEEKVRAQNMVVRRNICDSRVIIRSQLAALLHKKKDMSGAPAVEEEEDLGPPMPLFAEFKKMLNPETKGTILEQQEMTSRNNKDRALRLVGKCPNSTDSYYHNWYRRPIIRLFMKVSVLKSKRKLEKAFKTQLSLKQFHRILSRRGLTGKVMRIDRSDNTCNIRFDGQIGSEASETWMPIESLMQRQLPATMLNAVVGARNVYFDRIRTFYDEAAMQRRGSIMKKQKSTRGTIRLLYDYYARVFSAKQQLGKGNGSFVGLEFANSTMAFGELMYFLRDMRVVPRLVSRKEVQWLWNHNREEHSLNASDAGPKRIGKEIGFEGFIKMLVQIALLNAATPSGRIHVLGENEENSKGIEKRGRLPKLRMKKRNNNNTIKTAGDVIEALVIFLHLHERGYVKRHLTEKVIKTNVSSVEKDANKREVGCSGTKGATSTPIDQLPRFQYKQKLGDILQRYAVSKQTGKRRWAEFTQFSNEGLLTPHIDMGGASGGIEEGQICWFKVALDVKIKTKTCLKKGEEMTLFSEVLPPKLHSRVAVSAKFSRNEPITTTDFRRTLLIAAKPVVYKFKSKSSEGQARAEEFLGKVIIRARNTSTGKTLGSMEIPFYVFVVDRLTSIRIARLNRVKLLAKGLPTDTTGAPEEEENYQIEEWKLGGAAQASPTMLRRIKQRNKKRKERKIDKRVRQKAHIWKYQGADNRAQVIASINLLTKKKHLRGVDFRDGKVVKLLQATLRNARGKQTSTKELTEEEEALLDDGYGEKPGKIVYDRVKELGDRGCFGGAADR